MLLYALYAVFSPILFLLKKIAQKNNTKLTGYGLEDDETKPGQKAFTFTVGDSTIVAALNDALPGMKIGETRRLAVLVSFSKCV